MSFWNLYTEQNKTPVYVATDYNKLRSELKPKSQRQDSPPSSMQPNRLSNCSEQTSKLEECAEQNQHFFRHFTMNVPECHDLMDSYNSCIREKKVI